MTKTGRATSRLIGGIQCGLGLLASVVAFLIFASPVAREAMAVTSEQEIYLYLFLFLVFSVFSMISGLILIREENSEGLR